MLTYTFSTREKVLLAILAFVGVAILWYQLVFQNIQNQISSLDSQIATAQEELVTYQSRAAAVKNMQSVVEEYQAQGVEPIKVPSFDNTQNLMAYLNGVLANTKDYSMAFEDPKFSQEDGSVHRTGSISFTTDSYESARSVLQSIARGPYPCQIDTMSITTGASRGSNADTATVNAQLTFFELPSADALPTSEDDGIAEGNDWSQYMDL